MFSGFDNIAEGFKRFSLDALQREEEANDNETPKRTHVPDSVMQPTAPVAPTEVTHAITRSIKEEDEWDWEPRDPGLAEKLSTRVRERAAQRRDDVRLEPSLAEARPTFTAMSGQGDAAASLAKINISPDEAYSHLGNSHQGECRAPNMPGSGQIISNYGVKIPKLVDDQRGTKVAEQHDLGESVAVRTFEHPVSHQQVQEQDVSTNAIVAIGGEAVKYTRHIISEPVIPASTGTTNALIEEIAAGVEDEGSSAPWKVGTMALGSDGVIKNNGEGGGGGGSSGAPRFGYAEERKGLEMQGDEQTAVAGKVSMDDGHGTKQAAQATADGDVWRASQRELSQANSTLSALQGALRDSQYEVARLRDIVSTQENKMRRQEENIAHLSDEISTARVGFKQSHEAHQRTAQRSHAFEREFENTRRTIDALRTEKTALKEQVDVGLEDRKALEAQLCQLQAGLTEGQEAARMEARKETERMETRLKEVMKERDRKNAELELQNARRKETREMARDLESQLAAVDRISQEREAELIKLREEIAGLRKDSGEATEKKNTWATKYDALERNFKQVRAQGKKAEAELEQMRHTIGRIEAEKTMLAERVEEEASERVTVVASIAHERDFLLRQVDLLEQEMTDLRRVEEAHATVAAARAQKTGVLEEYRSRAQQALKRANEVASQTTAENKQLEINMAKLSAEVARQRPLWEEAKQQEKLHLAELAELKSQLSIAVSNRENTGTQVASLEECLAREEEERSATLASVVRLEAQGKSLRQELQKQRKALAAAEEREAKLEKRLTEKGSAMHAVEDQHQHPANIRTEGISGLAKFPVSPLPVGQSPSLEWDSEKLAQRNGMNSEIPEVPGVAWTNRLRSHGSTHSLQSEAESTDPPSGSAAEQLFYVYQLRERMSREQVEMRSLISEVEASRAKADAQAVKQAQLEKRLEAALLDKKRLQELDQGRNASINLEYLKNCVVGCLRTSEPSEHARLLPVITTILKLSREEADVIAKNITARAQHQGSFGGSLPLPTSKTEAGNRTEARAASGVKWWSTK